MFKKTRRQVPLPEIFIQPAKRNEIQPMLYTSVEGIMQQRGNVTKQGSHRNHIHGVVIKNPLQGSRVTRAEVIKIQPWDLIPGDFLNGARGKQDVLFEILERTRREAVPPQAPGKG